MPLLAQLDMDNTSMMPPPNRPPAPAAELARCSTGGAAATQVQRYSCMGIAQALAEREPSSRGSAEVEAATVQGAAAGHTEDKRGPSGSMLRLLLRARDFAAAGFTDSARRHAVDALQFHHAAKRRATAIVAAGERLFTARAHAETVSNVPGVAQQSRTAGVDHLDRAPSVAPRAPQVPTSCQAPPMT